MEDYIRLPHSIYRKNKYGKIIEKVEFPETAEGIFDINNVYAEDESDLVSITDRLLNMALESISSQGGKATSTDPYISDWLSKRSV